VVAEERLELLSLARLEAERRDERTLPEARELAVVARAVDLDEEAVLRVRVADAHRRRRRVRDVHDAADALARDEVRRVELQVHADLARRRAEGGRPREDRGEKEERRALHGVTPSES
jgi:hypothetical protein